MDSFKRTADIIKFWDKTYYLYTNTDDAAQCWGSLVILLFVNVAVSINIVTKWYFISLAVYKQYFYYG